MSFEITQASIMLQERVIAMGKNAELRKKSEEEMMEFLAPYAKELETEINNKLRTSPFGSFHDSKFVCLGGENHPHIQQPFTISCYGSVFQGRVQLYNHQIHYVVTSMAGDQATYRFWFSLRYTDGVPGPVWFFGDEKIGRANNTADYILRDVLQTSYARLNLF